jgi:hypothetical protein
MTGYNDILRFRQFEERIAKLGFRMGYPEHGYRREDTLALMPEGDHWPVYARDANVFIGTLAETEVWLNGMEWGVNYLKMLKVVDDKKIHRKEQDYRNEQLANTIKKVVVNDD